jgi:hypothetical protein
MTNDKITEIRVLEGEPCLLLCYDRVTGKSFEVDYDFRSTAKTELDSEKFEMRYEFLYRKMSPNQNLKVLSKVQWARLMKNQWEENVTLKLSASYHPDFEVRYFSDDPGENTLAARAHFVMEVVSVINEVKRLEELLVTNPTSESIRFDLMLEQERLSRLKSFFIKYPDILNFDEELSDFEKSKLIDHDFVEVSDKWIDIERVILHQLRF